MVRLDAQEGDILMAHNCPECDEVCYCRGDWDDCIIDDEESVSACSHHCLEMELEDYPDEEGDY